MTRHGTHGIGQQGGPVGNLHQIIHGKDERPVSIANEFDRLAMQAMKNRIQSLRPVGQRLIGLPITEGQQARTQGRIGLLGAQGGSHRQHI